MEKSVKAVSITIEWACQLDVLVHLDGNEERCERSSETGHMLFRDSTFVASKPAVTIVSPVLTENVIRCESL